jgi:hypothetical protein
MRHGTDIDAAEFMDSLIDLGFIDAIDDRPVGTAPPPPSLRWLHARHVRWIFRWPVLSCVYAVIVAGWIAAAVRHDLIPSYRAFLITSWPGINIAWNTAMVLTAIAMHEFWHLAAARAEDVYARIGLGTRLQFLVAQTTVSGLWGSPRRIRLRVFLAGVTSDLVIIAGCSLAISLAGPAGFARRSLEALILALLLSIASEFALYMRTDMYFVLQEALKCKNLYTDACDYARYAGRMLLARITHGYPPINPIRAVPRHERTPIKVYSALMALGSLVTLAVFTFFEAPIFIVLFVKAIENIYAGMTHERFLRVWDGAVVIGVEGTLQVIFLRLVLAKHGSRLRGAFRWFRGRSPSRSSGGINAVSSG